MIWAFSWQKVSNNQPEISHMPRSKYKVNARLYIFNVFIINDMISYHFCDLLLHSNWFQCQWLFKPYQHHQLLYHCHCCHHSKKQPQQPPSQPHHHYQQQMPASISKYVIFALYALQYMAFIFLSWFLSRAMARRAISLERKMLMICWMRLKVCTGLCYSHHLVALGLVCAWNWCTHPAHFVHIGP